jgi:hypothetical protein
MPEIVDAESVTALGEAVRDNVLVAGSHAGIIAAFLGATAGARALILNDAGVGRDGAGIAGLDWLERIGIAAAAVGHDTARIGDGADARARGRITHLNATAAALGVRAGMACAEAAERMRAAPPRRTTPPPYAEARFALDTRAEPVVWGLDSIGKLAPEDAGRILVIGSHGALHGGRPASALPIDAAAAAFHDAGIGIDGAGISRLPVLDDRGIPCVAVAGDSARIGDARSMWETGRVSVPNRTAARLGVAPGDALPTFVAKVRRGPAGSP